MRSRAWGRTRNKHKGGGYDAIDNLYSVMDHITTSRAARTFVVSPVLVAQTLTGGRGDLEFSIPRYLNIVIASK